MLSRVVTGRRAAAAWAKLRGPTGRRWVNWLLTLLLVTGVGSLLLPAVRQYPATVHDHFANSDAWQRRLACLAASFGVVYLLAALLKPRLAHLGRQAVVSRPPIWLAVVVAAVFVCGLDLAVGLGPVGYDATANEWAGYVAGGWLLTASLRLLSPAPSKPDPPAPEPVELPLEEFIRDWPTVERWLSSEAAAEVDIIGNRRVAQLLAERLMCNWGNEPATRCYRPRRPMLEGLRRTSRAGQRAVIYSPCKSWRNCGGCRNRHRNRLGQHFWLYVLAWGDPGRLTDLGFDVPDGALNAAQEGLHGLYAALVPPERLASVKRCLNRSQSEWLRITTAADLASRVLIKLSDTPDQMRMAKEDTEGVGDHAGCDRNNVAELVLAAVPPGKEPPPNFRRIGCDEALTLIEAGLRLIPEASDAERFRPVDCSAGWRCREDDHLERKWRREGECAHSVETLRELVVAADIVPAVESQAIQSENVQDSVLWSDASAGGPANAWHFAFLIQPDEGKKARDLDTILQRFNWWRSLLRNYPVCGENVRRELAARTDRPHRAADTEALTAAAELDAEARRRADEFDAECERMAAENRREFGAEWMADLELSEDPNLRKFFGLPHNPRRRRRSRVARPNITENPQYAAFMATAGCHTKRTNRTN